MKFIRHISHLPDTWPDTCSLRYGGGKTNTSTSSVAIPPEILSRYNAVNSQAQTVAQTPFQQYSTDPNAFVAPLDATQNAGILGTNEYSAQAQPFYQTASNEANTGYNTASQGYGNIGAGAATAAAGYSGLNAGLGTAEAGYGDITGGYGTAQQGYGAIGTGLNTATSGYGGISSGLGQMGAAAGLVNQGSGAANAQQLTPGYIQQFENPYAQNVIAPTSALMEQQFNQAQSGQLGNAINNGAFGGDRSAITAANLQQQEGLAYGQTIGGLEGSMYNTALGAAQQQQGVNLGAQQANLARLQQAGTNLAGIGTAQGNLGSQYGQLGATEAGIGSQYGQLGSTEAGIGSQLGALGSTEAGIGAQYGNLGTAQAGIGAQYGNLGTAQANIGTAEGNIGAGAQAAGLSGAQAQLTAGQAQQQTEQAGLTALYNQFLQQQSYPFQTTQFLANIAEGTGALSGSNTSSTSPAPFFSDERLKTDIKPIGKTFDGQNIVKFRYRGEPHTRIGLIAQDVERKHPSAVGLAGGYRTVDYDEATHDAAAMGRFRKASGGGLVPESLERHGFDIGGPAMYSGLGPSSSYAGGFYVDPSYLMAQQQAYSALPGSGTNPLLGSSPYGGKSYVPTTGSGVHAALATARPPQQSQQSGLRQLTSTVGDLEKLGETGKGLWNGAKGLVPNQSTTTTATPAPATGGLTNSPAPANNNNASAGVSALNDNRSPLTGADADIAAAQLEDLSAARGGVIPFRRKRDSGGSAQDQPDDDIPYDYGTGMKGLNIPNDKPLSAKLATAQVPGNSNQQSALGGLSSIAGLASALPGIGTDLSAVGSAIAPMLLAFRDGGLVPRLHRDAGGMTSFADMPLPDLTSGAGQLRKEQAAAAVPPPVIPSNATAQVPPSGSTVPPTDYSSDPGPVTKPTVRVPSEAPGLATSEQQGRGLLGQNQDYTVPAMRALGKGLLTALSSNSKYGLVGIGQGIGAGLDEYGNAYEQTQNDMAGRGQVGANTVHGLAGAGFTQSQTGLTQSETTGQNLTNEKLRQATQAGDFMSFGGQDYVVVDDGHGHPHNILAADWLANGSPPTYHQVHGAMGTAPVSAPPPSSIPPPTAIPPIQSNSPPVEQQPTKGFGSVGPGGVQQAQTAFKDYLLNPPKFQQQKVLSDAEEGGMLQAFHSSLQQKSILNQMSANIANMVPGAGMPGAWHEVTASVANKWNGLVDQFGGNPGLKVNPQNIAAGWDQNKLDGMAAFARTHGSAQNSLGALQTAESAVPNMNMDKGSLAKVMASLYTDNQQDIDKYNYLKDYEGVVAATHPTQSKLYTAQDAMTGFYNKDNKLGQYGQETPKLEQFFNETVKKDGKSVPMITAYNQGLTPAQKKLVQERYGPNIFRYFGGQ